MSIGAAANEIEWNRNVRMPCWKLIRMGDDCQIWNQWRKDNPDKPTDLSDIALVGANLSGGNFNNTNFNSADLTGADLSYAEFNGCSLRFSKLIGANFTDVSARNANLWESNFSNAILNNVNFSGTDLSSVNFSNAKLSNADLSGTDLRGADFTNATLIDVNLANATIGKSGWFSKKTKFINVDLSSVEGLDKVQHKGGADIDTATIRKSHGLISESFLQQCGVYGALFELAKTLKAQAPQKPTHPTSGLSLMKLFISYSRHDAAFVYKLETTLRAMVQHVWVDHQLTGGDRWLREIEKQIDVCDAMLVVLSPSSVISSYVEAEYHQAHQKGRRLIPIGYRRCEIPLLLSTSQVVDFEQTPYNDAIERLYEALNSKR